MLTLTSTTLTLDNERGCLDRAVALGSITHRERDAYLVNGTTFGDRLELIKRKRGGALLIENLKNKTVFHWLLVKSVKQSGSHYLAAAMPEARRIAEEELGLGIRLVIKRGEGA
jgi:hypothetical protein